MKKSIISIISCMVVFTILNISSVKAAEESVVLTPGDDSVLVTLHIDPVNEAYSLKASFKIEASKGNLKDVKFNFDKSMSSTVNEYRYHADRNILTVYISGNKKLLSMDTVSLGSINFDAEDSTEVNVTFIKDSLQYVEAGYEKTDLVLEDSSASWTNDPTSNPEDEESSNPDNPSDPGDSDGSNEPGVSDEEIGSGETTITPPSDESGINKQDEVTSTQDESNKASNAETGAQINILLYACLTVSSLIAILLIVKRHITKVNH